MQKIGASTSSANALGEFTEGNPAAGIPATLLKAGWLNTMQRELVNLVVAAGLTPDVADDSQVLKAIQVLLASAASWSRLTGKPNTLSGFGINDAFTKAEVSAAIQAATAALVGSAPDALNAINELAAAINNDPQFATSMLNLLGGKANKGTTLAEYGITDAVKFSDKAMQVDAEGGVDNAKWVTVAGVSVVLSSAFAGCVTYFARNTPPGGWLKANGALVSRTTYSRLFSSIGTTFGAGDGVTTFALPDLRGEFVRGWDDSRGVDSGRALGSLQADELKSHIHTVPADTGWVYSAGSSSNAKPQQSGSSSISTGSTGGTETRPRNMALLACIKY